MGSAPTGIAALRAYLRPWRPCSSVLDMYLQRPTWRTDFALPTVLKAGRTSHRQPEKESAK